MGELDKISGGVNNPGFNNVGGEVKKTAENEAAQKLDSRMEAMPGSPPKNHTESKGAHSDTVFDKVSVPNSSGANAGALQKSVNKMNRKRNIGDVLNKGTASPQQEAESHILNEIVKENLPNRSNEELFKLLDELEPGLGKSPVAESPERPQRRRFVGESKGTPTPAPTQSSKETTRSFKRVDGDNLLPSNTPVTIGQSKKSTYDANVSEDVRIIGELREARAIKLELQERLIKEPRNKSSISEELAIVENSINKLLEWQKKNKSSS